MFPFRFLVFSPTYPNRNQMCSIIYSIQKSRESCDLPNKLYEPTYFTFRSINNEAVTLRLYVAKNYCYRHLVGTFLVDKVPGPSGNNGDDNDNRQHDLPG